MPTIITAPPVITCPPWCTESHIDDWSNDDNGLPVRLHQHQHGQVAVVAEEHLTDGRFTTDDPMILADVTEQLPIEQAEQFAQDLQAAVGMARSILAGAQSGRISHSGDGA